MRIARLSDLQRKDRGKGDEPGMSPWAQAQIEAAFSEIKSDEPLRGKGRAHRSPGADTSKVEGSRTRSTRGESAGEAAVGLALRAAFGDWHKDSGEVVKELMPFSTRRFRADYAFPDVRVAVEILLTPPCILLQIHQDLGAGMNWVAIEL